MAAGELDLEIENGGDFLAEIELFNDDGSAVDLNGYDIEAQIRETPNNVNVAAQFAITVVTVSPAKIQIALTGAQTQAIKTIGRTVKDKTAYVWGLKVTDANGFATHLLAGFAYIYPRVPR